MMNVFNISRAALVLGIVLILSVGNAVKGEQCSSYELLEPQELQKGNCQQLINGTHERYLRMECIVSRNNYYFNTRKCLSKWCQYIASCLNQTTEWKMLCSEKFYRFRTSQFVISAVAEGVNASYIRNIHVKYCSKTYLYRYKARLQFSIKTTGYRCESEKAKNVNPCSGQWIGNSNKCDKLVNGTNGSWYRVFSKENWCESFKSCFQSTNLQARCLKDFAFFYYHFLHYPAFTFEITTYLSGTRIQINYECSYPYLFAVNIIQCDSIAKNNESEIELGNDGDDDDDDDDDDYDLNTEIINAINTLDVQKNESLQAAVKVFDTKIKEYVNRTSLPGKSLNKTRQQKMEDVFMATIPFEEFVIRFGQFHLTQKTAPLIHLTNENMDLQVRRRFYENESDFHLVEPQKQNYIRIPAEDFHNGSVLLGVVYKDLHELFITNQTKTNIINKTSKSLNTMIMSATIYPQPVTLQQNVTLMFTNVLEATRKRECVFWNFSENSPMGWSGQGCDVKSMNDSKTECSCNHLTHFAVLMQFDTNDDAGSKKGPGISETDDKILNILTYLGLTLSLIGIISTIICYAFLTDVKAPLSQIRISLVASLGAGQIVFIAGIGATENKGVCVTVAALMQYFLMAAFCWMLIEGIYLYLFVVKVYNVSNKVKLCHGVSWGLPVVMVVLSLSIAAGKDGIQSFVSEKYCWMSSSNSLIWIFVSFVIFIEVLNVLILARVIKEMTAMEQAKDSQAEQIRLGVRACVVLIPLLGVTWLFGLLVSTHKAFVYIFTIFNSTQGFFVFLLHCVRNSEIRERFKRRIRLIFPAASEGNISVKRKSELNESSGILSLRKIEVMPKSTESLVKTSL